MECGARVGGEGRERAWEEKEGERGKGGRVGGKGGSRREGSKGTSKVRQEE